MAIYFAAASDGAALDALAAPLDGAEALESPVVPESDGFSFLIELVRGDERVEDPVAAQVAVVETDSDEERLVRLGEMVRDGIADADQRTVQELARLWAANADVNRLGIDAESFLTDLQHLCRNARATDSSVYAIGRS